MTSTSTPPPTIPSATDPHEGGPPTDGAGRGDIGLILVVILAALALVFSFVAFATDGDQGLRAERADSSGPASLTLTEFAIEPGTVEVAEGGAIEIVNEGGQVHNVSVVGTDVKTVDLAGGESATLDVSSLAAGTYELICDIAGHAQAGMTSTLVVGGAGSGDGAGAPPAVEEPDWSALDEAMESSMAAFPAETEGVGNQPLAPVSVDGKTKRFELTAQIVEWEVEPGRFVEAWTYNGMVPGPWIKVDVGDNVQVHVQNDLPMGTDIHWHGIRTPNDMDGVAPITQDLIRSGEDFTYEFVAERKAVGMYHAHHHGQMQVPNGMLGVIQIGDVDLPRGRTISGVQIPADLEVAQELPMVLNDAGTIGLSLNGKSFPATAPVVVNEGDWILVHYANEGLQIHPMHQHQFPQLVVAKDGIPLDNPYYADTVNVAPGERYSVLIHADDVGTWVWHCHILNHVERDEGMFGMVTAMVVQ